MALGRQGCQPGLRVSLQGVPRSCVGAGPKAEHARRTVRRLPGAAECWRRSTEVGRIEREGRRRRRRARFERRAGGRVVRHGAHGCYLLDKNCGRAQARPCAQPRERGCARTQGSAGEGSSSINGRRRMGSCCSGSSSTIPASPSASADAICMARSDRVFGRERCANALRKGGRHSPSRAARRRPLVRVRLVVRAWLTSPAVARVRIRLRACAYASRWCVHDLDRTGRTRGSSRPSPNGRCVRGAPSPSPSPRERLCDATLTISADSAPSATADGAGPTRRTPQRPLGAAPITTPERPLYLGVAGL